ncbi:hypothetical protein [Streptomyces scabiei]|uniref:hypothetical protein n=1 Tax=Streptomyces scabiei TaxID=1930 RepID=UPI000A9E43F9|nr:hypothetical protein [Streptomyces scabiei]
MSMAIPYGENSVATRPSSPCWSRSKGRPRREAKTFAAVRVERMPASAASCPVAAVKGRRHSPAAMARTTSWSSDRCRS